LQGLKGDTGSPGATGPEGAVGPQGPAGADGASTWEAISGKPSTFTPSAHTHTVSAITDFPTIPAAQVNSDWTATSGLAQILNKPDLANLPNQQVNGDSSPFFADLYTGDGVYFNSDGTEGQGILFKSLQLPSCSIGAMGNANRANGIIRDGQNLFFGNADGSFWNKLAFASLDNSFSVGQTITAAANTSALTASYSVTGANTTPLLNLSGDWNTTGIARGILLNITDTASNAASLVADFQRNGTSVASITKTGAYNINAAGLPSSGIGWTSSAHLALTHNGTVRGIVNSLGITANADTNLGFNFAASNNSGTAFHARILCDGTGVVALRNGTNAQTFRLYNTFTDASNYERGFMRWNSNVLEIGTEAGGTGTNRSLSLLASGGNVTITPSSGSTCIVQSGANPSFSVGISGESLARARLQTDAVSFGAGGSSSRDMFLMRGSSTLFEINNGIAGTLRDLRVRNVIQRSGIATTVTPASNGDLVIEQTSDTSITFKMRGSDGTVRSASLTLA
jgi:hypothetical protein